MPLPGLSQLDQPLLPEEVEACSILPCCGRVERDPEDGILKEGAVNPHNLHAIYLMQSILTTKAGPVHLVLLTYIRYNENLTD